ncbi:hypothetical protein TWF694_010127 [Orbilia ellipsospora]|uniref:tyrosinase n=1 Tax=Orbilia ellipsospora TaxID=2528407 RepID=A0AAV9XFA3_9PEZI
MAEPQVRIPPPPRVRISLQQMQDEYDEGNREPLRNLIKAWIEIQKRPPSHPYSFFRIAGYHGEPFRGTGATTSNQNWWGGFCHHGNVLFPTWHRAYVLTIENALRSVEGCENVTLPFWDECIYDNPRPPTPPSNVIPTVLTSKTFDLDDGNGPVPNPLYSYSFAKAIKDLANDDADYSKPAGYETVRYPLSGLVGTKDVVNTMDHNRNYTNEAENIATLNGNVYNWLTGSIKITPDPDEPTRYPDTFSVFERFKRCLVAPNYNIFSNTSSQAYWIDQAEQTDKNYYESLESPHNAIHLAVGGFYVPGLYNADEILGANGDMGENDTAAFDPIFFFHHCWIDNVFWLWQQKNDKTENLGLISDYNDPGLNSTGIAGSPQGEMLNLDTKLYPFEYTSKQVTNIADLEYSYGPSSLSPYVAAPEGDRYRLPSLRGQLHGVVKASGLTRDTISGSFVVEIHAVRGGEEILIHREAVLSRWGIQGCLNCQNHLELNILAPVHQRLLDLPGEGEWTYKSTVKDRKYSGIAKPRLSLLPPGVANAHTNFVKYG